MTDSFEQIQQMIHQLLPIVLLGPGVVLTGMGLFMWLGGLRWLKAIAAFTLASIGFSCAWHFTERQMVPMVLFPIIAAALGMFFHKVVVVILGGLLAAAVVLAIPAASEFHLQVLPAENNRQQNDDFPQLNFMQSIERIEAQITYSIEQITAYIKSIPKQRISLAFMVALGVMGFGFFSWRLVCAATCATFGTSLIAAGLFLLLLYKGDGPVQIIAEKKQLIIIITLAMIGIGTMLEMMLCPAKKKKKDSLEDILNQGDG